MNRKISFKRIDKRRGAAIARCAAESEPPLQAE
jgi:hypothetical protein